MLNEKALDKKRATAAFLNLCLHGEAVLWLSSAWNSTQLMKACGGPLKMKEQTMSG